MSDLADLFPGFASKWIDTSKALIEFFTVP
jgi:hypothetical protein